MYNKRLMLICNYINKNSIVADIGTDHGIIPIYLLKNNLAKKVIATDISENSLEKLIIKLNSCNFKNIETRVCDGLCNFKPYEIDTCIISGMGGILISKILDDNINVAKTINKLILSPNNANDYLRNFLLKNGFTVEDEVDIIENDKYYQIIIVKRGIDYYKNDSELEYGKFILKNKSNNFISYLKSELIKLLNVKSNLENYDDNLRVINKIDYLDKRIEQIRGILNEV